VSRRAVLFDAGNTLLFLDYARMAPAVGDAVGQPLTAAGLESVAVEAARSLERREGTDRERASRYLETLFRLAGVPESEAVVVRDTLFRLHQERHLWATLHPGTREALERLQRAGLTLGVVSNSDGRAAEGLAAAGLLEYFAVVIDSQLVGFEKPDPRIFQAALARLDLQPDEALYVGDLYEIDVVGARAAGLDVILLDPAGQHRDRDVVTCASLAEVVSRVLAQ
jgi:putative hydrolase of the HAD superfamily